MLASAQPLFHGPRLPAARRDHRGSGPALNLLGDGLRDALDPRETPR
jgi:hypothetical protein